MICLAFFLPACYPAGNLASATLPINTPTTGPAQKPSPTANEKLTETATPTPFPIITSTVTPTVTPTPIALPNLRTVYNNMDGIWVVRPPEPPVLLVAKIIVDKMLLSDDGARIIFLGYSYPPYADEVLAINFNGSHNQTLLNPKQISQLEFYDYPFDTLIENIDCIPGTHHMLFTTVGPAARHRIYAPNNNLFKLNTDSGQWIKLFPKGKGGDVTPSPDGKRMAVANTGVLFLATIQGKILNSDIFPSGFDGERQFFYPQVVWTEDSSHIGIILRSHGEASIWSIEISTGTASPLGNIGQFRQGALSPTLDYVGYALYENEFITRDVTLSKVDGSSSIRLANGLSEFRTFSPDGRHYAYTVGCTWNYGCPKGALRPKVFIGSLDGTSFQVSGAIGIKWINNTQFVYVADKSLRLGDIGGNSIELAHADYFRIFDAKDLDFQAGRTG